jgi:hypothetical protein
MTTEINDQTIDEIVYDFDLIDERARAIGASAIIRRVELAEDERGWRNTPPGIYFVVYGYQTRSGFSFGSGTDSRWFKTEQEAREYAVKYLEGARKRAVKRYGSGEPEIRPTFSRINRAIRYLGLRLKGNGDGYFYFIDTKTGYQVGRNVDRPRLHHAPIETWVQDAVIARNSGILEGIANT